MTITVRLLAFALFCAGWLWLNWGSHDTAATAVSWAMTIGIVIYALYQWSVWNLAKAREHDEDLR